MTGWSLHVIPVLCTCKCIHPGVTQHNIISLYNAYRGLNLSHHKKCTLQYISCKVRTYVITYNILPCTKYTTYIRVCKSAMRVLTPVILGALTIYGSYVNVERSIHMYRGCITYSTYAAHLSYVIPHSCII